jgi:putative transposase
MPQSLAFVLVHVVFSTKDRIPMIGEDVRVGLYAYLATVARELGCECYRVGGMADHVHLSVRMSREVAVAELVGKLKSLSSHWLKHDRGLLEFAWQRGYAAFSVGPSDLQALIGYIEAQEVHHAKRDFQEEFRALLRKYGVEFDERYVWD